MPADFKGMEDAKPFPDGADSAQLSEDDTVNVNRALTYVRSDVSLDLITTVDAAYADFAKQVQDFHLYEAQSPDAAEGVIRLVLANLSFEFSGEVDRIILKEMSESNASIETGEPNVAAQGPGLRFGAAPEPEFSLDKAGSLSGPSNVPEDGFDFRPVPDQNERGAHGDWDLTDAELEIAKDLVILLVPEGMETGAGADDQTDPSGFGVVPFDEPLISPL